MVIVMLDRIIRPGSIKINNRSENIFCKIKFEADKLSITGVISPTQKNAKGSVGQIDMDFAHRDARDNDDRTDHLIGPTEITFAPEWNADKWLEFLDVWIQYHCNDMRRGCEHQESERWGNDIIRTIKYQLKSEVLDQQREISERIMKAIGVRSLDTNMIFIIINMLFTSADEYKRLKKEYNKLNITDEEIKILARPFNMKMPDDVKLPNMLIDHYNMIEVITQHSRELTYDEDPRGVLLKSCPVCGYKYGESWNKIEVPQKVLKFLGDLPNTDIEPYWV